MQDNIQLLDVVALTEDVSAHHLRRGQVGTVVEELAPNMFEVEFNDNYGRTYAMCALQADQVMVLHYQAADVVSKDQQ